jgi:hypothetical protein
MGAAMIEGMLEVDTVFELQLLPGADGKEDNQQKQQ